MTRTRVLRGYTAQARWLAQVEDGPLHGQRAHFLSSPLDFRAPGSNWSFPAVGCAECVATPSDPAAPRSHPIARAYDHGMSPAAIARFTLDAAAWEGGAA